MHFIETDGSLINISQLPLEEGEELGRTAPIGHQCAIDPAVYEVPTERFICPSRRPAGCYAELLFANDSSRSSCRCRQKQLAGNLSMHLHRNKEDGFDSIFRVGGERRAPEGVAFPLTDWLSCLSALVTPLTLFVELLDGIMEKSTAKQWATTATPPV